MSKSITPKYVTLRDAATYSGFAVFTLRDKIACGELPAFRISDKPGAAIRVRIDDIDALMKPVVPPEVYAHRDNPSPRKPTARGANSPPRKRVS